MRYAIIGAVFAVIAHTCVTHRVLNLFALRLGGRELYLGILNFAMTVCWITRAFTMHQIEKHGKKPVMLFWSMVSVLITATFLLIPPATNHLSQNICLGATLIIAVARMSTIHMESAGWFPILHDIVPAQVRGRFFANIRTTWRTAELITILLLAWLLGTEPPLWKFEIIFLVAVVAYSLRIVAFLPMSEVPLSQPADTTQNILTRIREIIETPRLRYLTLYCGSFLFGMLFIEPFRIKYLRDMGYSDGFVLAGGAVFSLGSILTLRFWGRLVDRFGTRMVFSSTSFAIALVSLAWLLVFENDHVLVMSLIFLLGIFFSANVLAQTRYQLNAVPSNKQNQINTMQIVIGLFAAAGPMFGGLFLRMTDWMSFDMGGYPFHNYQLLFVVSALLLIVPHVLRKRLREPRDASTAEVVLIASRTLRSSLGPFVRLSGRRKNRENDTKDA